MNDDSKQSSAKRDFLKISLFIGCLILLIGGGIFALKLYSGMRMDEQYDQLDNVWPDPISIGGYQDFVEGRAKAPCFFPKLSISREVNGEMRDLKWIEVPEDEYVRFSASWQSARAYDELLGIRWEFGEWAEFEMRIFAVGEVDDMTLFEIEIVDDTSSEQPFSLGLLVANADEGSPDPFTQVPEAQAQVKRAWIGRAGEVPIEIGVMTPKEMKAFFQTKTAYVSSAQNDLGSFTTSGDTGGPLKLTKIPESHQPFPRLDWDAIKSILEATD